MAESFFKTLKTELIYQNEYQTSQEAKQLDILIKFTTQIKGRNQ